MSDQLFSPLMTGPNNSQLPPLKRGAKEEPASCARFQFRETANESKDCQMKRARSDHDASVSNEGRYP
jgi:hypothetical protein